MTLIQTDWWHFMQVTSSKCLIAGLVCGGLGFVRVFVVVLFWVFLRLCSLRQLSPL